MLGWLSSFVCWENMEWRYCVNGCDRVGRGALARAGGELVSGSGCRWFACLLCELCVARDLACCEHAQSLVWLRCLFVNGHSGSVIPWSDVGGLRRGRSISLVGSLSARCLWVGLSVHGTYILSFVRIVVCGVMRLPGSISRFIVVSGSVFCCTCVVMFALLRALHVRSFCICRSVSIFDCCSVVGCVAHLCVEMVHRFDLVV